jgi:hypothetical protein
LEGALNAISKRVNGYSKYEVKIAIMKVEEYECRRYMLSLYVISYGRWSRIMFSIIFSSMDILKWRNSKGRRYMASFYAIVMNVGFVYYSV